MHDQIQVHGFLPIDVGIADGQLLAVLPEHVHLRLEFWQVSRRRLHVLLSHEEQQVVAVDRVLCLEEEVPDKQVRPVGCTLKYHEAGVCGMEHGREINKKKKTNVCGSIRARREEESIGDKGCERSNGWKKKKIKTDIFN